MKFKELMEELNNYNIIQIKSLSIDEYESDLADMEIGELEAELEKIESSFTRALKNNDYKDVKQKIEEMRQLVKKALKTFEEIEDEEVITQTSDPVVGGMDVVQDDPLPTETPVTEPSPDELQDDNLVLGL